MTKISQSGAVSFQQRYLDGLEELVELHRQLASLEASIAERKQEILELKGSCSKKRKSNSSQHPESAKKTKKAEKIDHVNWLDIVIKHLPDAFDALTPRKGQQIKESVYEFLKLKLDNEQIRKLELPNQDYDIPVGLIDPFVVWIKQQIAKITETPPKKRSSTSEGSKQQKKNANKSVPIWKTWAETIRQVLPTYRVESIHSHFAKSFLAQYSSEIEKLKGDENIAVSSELCIPKELTVIFLEQFFKKFPKVKRCEKDEARNVAPKGSIISPAKPADKSFKITAWQDICHAMFPLEMEKIMASLELEKNVSWSVGKFVAEKISALNIELAQCIVDSDTRKIKTFGIPLSLESQFVGWFRGKLQTGFDAYVDSMDTIEYGQGLQPPLEGNIEEEDLNSFQISGLLEQLVSGPNSKNDVGQNDDPTAITLFGPFKPIPPPPSPIWSFSWLSESVNEEPPSERPKETSDFETNSDIGQNLPNVTSKDTDNNENTSPMDFNSVINISEYTYNTNMNGSEAQNLVSTTTGSDEVLNEFLYAATPPRSAADPAVSCIDPTISHVGSPIEPTPDCMPEATRIQTSLPLPDQSVFKKDLFGPLELDSISDHKSRKSIGNSEVNAESIKENGIAAELEHLNANMIDKPIITGILKVNEESPSKKVHVSEHCTETGVKNVAGEVRGEADYCRTQDLIRYNTIMLQLMPTYDKIDRPTRMQFKSKVHDFLVKELGEIGADNCIIIRNTGNESATTLGIPKELEIAFKKIAVNFLRQKYGVKKVAFQIWELSLPFDVDEVFGKQRGLIMSLIRQVAESLRQFIRSRTFVASLALKRSEGSLGNKPSLPSQEKCSSTAATPVADNRQEPKEASTCRHIRSDNYVILISDSEESEICPTNIVRKRRNIISDSDNSSDMKIHRTQTFAKTLSSIGGNLSGLATPKSTPKSRKRSRNSHDKNAQVFPKPLVLPPEPDKITATILADLHDLQRYTRLVLNIMPSFSKAPRLARMHIRDQVQKWLFSKLGETLAHECVIWTRTPSGQLFATLGIPKKLEDSFNEWIKDLLKDLSTSRSETA